jgi:hypothetical protein
VEVEEAHEECREKGEDEEVQEVRVGVPSPQLFLP